jgi:hypothetical protein
VVEHLPSKAQALNSNPSTTTTKKKGGGVISPGPKQLSVAVPSGITPETGTCGRPSGYHHNFSQTHQGGEHDNPDQSIIWLVPPCTQTVYGSLPYIWEPPHHVTLSPLPSHLHQEEDDDNTYPTGKARGLHGTMKHLAQA